jgi:hypothetical protein
MMGETIMPSMFRVDEDKKTQFVVKQLKRLKPGLWLWVTHLGIDSPEQDALIHTHPDHVFPGGGVGKHRAAELKAVTSIEDELPRRRAAGYQSRQPQFNRGKPRGIRP